MERCPKCGMYAVAFDSFLGTKACFNVFCNYVEGKRQKFSYGIEPDLLKELEEEERRRSTRARP